MRALGTVLVVM